MFISSLMFASIVEATSSQLANTYIYYDMETTITGPGAFGTRFMDQSGNGFHANNTNTSDVSGKIGRARGFNGVDSQLAFTFLGFTRNSSFSVSAWVNPTDLIGNRPIFSGSNALLRIENGGNTVNFFSNTGGFSCMETTAAPEFTPGVWTMVTGTYNDSTGDCAIFINGHPSFRQIGVNPSNIVLGTIGTIGSFGGTFWNGSIDEVYVFNRIITPPEIQCLASGGCIVAPPIGNSFTATFWALLLALGILYAIGIWGKFPILLIIASIVFLFFANEIREITQNNTVGTIFFAIALISILLPVYQIRDSVGN